MPFTYYALQRARRSPSRVTRYLSVSLWQEVKAFITQLPQQTATESAHAARARWLVTLLHLQA
jgi:hypothetical protein